MFRGCLFATFDSFAIPAALLVAPVFARLCRAIALLGFPSRPLPGRLPTLIAAIALPCAPRTKTLLTSLQQTAACPRAAAWLGHRTGFPNTSLTCRILNRAHGSEVPGSSSLGEELRSSPGRSMSGSTQTPESIADQRPTFPISALFGFSRIAGAVRPAPVFPLWIPARSGIPRGTGPPTRRPHRRHRLPAPWPLRPCHFGPFARRH